jgi:hypothetical protein
MTTTPIPGEHRRRLDQSAARHRDVWASLAITTIWLAVLFASVFGPDLVTAQGGASGNVSRVPSGVVIALFATIATWALARYAFREHRD